MTILAAWPRVRRLVREGIWVLFGQIMAVFGALAGVRLLTELLEPAAYGKLALGMTLATLVNQTILGPLGNGASRFYAPAAEQSELSGYINAVSHLGLLGTGIVLLLIFLTGTALLITGRAEWIALVTAALIFAILSGYNSIINGIQNAARQRAIVALHQGLEAWVRPLFAAGLMVLLGAYSTVAIVGYVLATLVILCSQYSFLRRVLPDRTTATATQADWKRLIWGYSWPFTVFGIFAWAQLSIDRWALELLTTTEDVGLYSVLYQVGYSPMQLATAMSMQFIAPIMFQRAGDGAEANRIMSANFLGQRLTALALVLTTIAVTMAFLFHRPLFALVVASKYRGVSYYLPWLLLAGGLFSTSQTIALNIMSQMRTQQMIAVKVVCALLAVIGSLIGAATYRIDGVVASTVIVAAIQLIWMLQIQNRGNAR